MIYEFTEDIKNIDCYSSNFLVNWRSYLIDEEYIKNDRFIRCPYCNSEKIRIENLYNRNVSNFIKKYNLYSKSFPKTYNYLKETLELMTIIASNPSICFCDSCKKIITASNKPFFMTYYLSASDYERIFKEENFFSESSEPLICPFCNEKHFFSEIQNIGHARNNIEYEYIYCSSCKHYVCSTRTDNFGYYHIDMNHLGKLLES